MDAPDGRLSHIIVLSDTPCGKTANACRRLYQVPPPIFTSKHAWTRKNDQRSNASREKKTHTRESSKKTTLVVYCIYLYLPIFLFNSCFILFLTIDRTINPCGLFRFARAVAYCLCFSFQELMYVSAYLVIAGRNACVPSFQTCDTWIPSPPHPAREPCIVHEIFSGVCLLQFLHSRVGTRYPHTNT